MFQKLIAYAKQHLSKRPKGAILLFAATVTSVALGFLREATTAYYFGTSSAYDTFLVALTLPQIIGVTSVQFTMAVILPQYIEYRQNSNFVAATALLKKWFWFASVVVGGTCIGLYFGAEIVVKLIAPGFSQEQIAQSTQWMQRLLPYVYVLSVAGIFNVVLDTNGKYAIPVLGNQFIAGSIIVSCLLFAPSIQLKALVIGYVGGSVFSFMWRYLFAKQHETSLLNIQFSHTPVSLPLKSAFIMLIYFTIQQINFIIDRFYASQLSEGSVAAFNFAQAINAVLVAIVTSVIGTIVFPRLSRLMARRDATAAFNTALKASAIGMVLILIPAAGLIVFREFAVSFLLERGKFDEQGVVLVSEALQWLPFRTPIHVIMVIFSLLLTASKKYLHLSATIVLFVISKTLLCEILIGTYQLKGLAGATVLATIVNAMILLVVCKRLFGRRAVVAS